MEGRSCKREAGSAYHERAAVRARWPKACRLVGIAFFAGTIDGFTKIRLTDPL